MVEATERGTAERTGAEDAGTDDRTAATAPGTGTARAGTAGLAGCWAGRWNQVASFVHPFWPEGRWYVADQPWIRVNWRWFSGGPLPYLEGSFTGRAHITAPPSPYTSIEFWCSADTNIQVV
ncbi:hypothetical protein [Plantactinospora sp. KLBMP9567]|uniref:hypothetical protein n=1 Tax=Plantactinospora sp. KLBMP9567 TaxID=3085900 RepID=UPI002981F458|nr:hypothetical protein [Plantactinospora sp. KLBMP9567]MDW5326054.1 hypothetical protein [Plantactinospora sp. KLBMP9567]